MALQSHGRKRSFEYDEYISPTFCNILFAAIETIPSVEMGNNNNSNNSNKK